MCGAQPGVTIVRFKNPRRRKMKMEKISNFTLPSCAASFTCSSFTCHPKVAWGAACVCRAWVPPLENEDGQDEHLHAPVKIVIVFGWESKTPNCRYSGRTHTRAGILGYRKRPHSVSAYAPTRSSNSTPRAPPPEPRSKPGLVFVASGGVINIPTGNTSAIRPENPSSNHSVMPFPAVSISSSSSSSEWALGLGFLEMQQAWLASCPVPGPAPLWGISSCRLRRPSA